MSGVVVVTGVPVSRAEESHPSTRDGNTGEEATGDYNKCQKRKKKKKKKKKKKNRHDTHTHTTMDTRKKKLFQLLIDFLLLIL